MNKIKGVVTDTEIEAIENGGVRMVITPEAALRTVQQGLGIESMSRDLLVKALDETKIKHKVQKPGKQTGKDEHGIPTFEDTVEEVEEVLSDYQKGFIILVPDTQKDSFKPGETIIYRLKGAQMFDWKDGLFLIQPYDVVGKMINKK
jgi:hypothetical protein